MNYPQMSNEEIESALKALEAEKQRRKVERVDTAFESIKHLDKPEMEMLQKKIADHLSPDFYANAQKQASSEFQRFAKEGGLK